MKIMNLITAGLLILMLVSCDEDNDTKTDNLPDITDYPIVTTGQTSFFNNTGEISEQDSGDAFYGQDANYKAGSTPSYTDNGDGTITDNVTGLMWEKSYSRSSYGNAESHASASTTGGHTDWRVPTTKQLYSLINFTGNQGTGDPNSVYPPADAVPFINTDYFEFDYPNDPSRRYIDVQYIASTEYVATVMNSEEAFFGVNFADGRIKGYPQDPIRDDWYIRLVRGNTTYGQNQFVDNNDNTVTDEATGLMWTKFDSGNEEFADLLSGFTYSDGSLNWEEALEFAENLEFAGHSDWRLPNVKELHSIVDYTRAPDATGSAAINNLFETTQIINEAGNTDYPFFWSSTTFEPGYDACIVQFGRSLGYIDGVFLDVHGAGGQRTDPKTGDPSYGMGPQGDVRRVYNYVRLVRNVN